MEFYQQAPIAMFSLLHFLLQRFDRFQAWFDKRFGWFFTNGMKSRHATRTGAFRA